MNIPMLILVFHVHYCTSQYPGTMKKTGNPYPKKVKLGMIQYNNAGKYAKLITETSKTKKTNNQRQYTAFAKPFPTAEIKPHHQIIPDSPYFPVDEPKEQERRVRVKKVLPEYALPVRHLVKRSADDNGDDKEKQLIATDSASSKIETPAPKRENPVQKTGDSKGATKSHNQKSKDSAKIGKAHGLRSGKKRRQVNSANKKKSVFRESFTKTGAKKLKVPRNQRINQKLSQPGLGRPKKLKTSQKTLTKSGLADRKIKAGRPQLGAQKLRNKNLKKPVQRKKTSKVKHAGNPKGLSARRLIAAKDALIEEYPYTISIQKDGMHWCSGAILNPRLIITTANCLWRSNTISRLRVRAGSRHTDRGGQVAKIQEVMKHPGWKLRKNPDNDVALALLDRKIRFSHGVHGVDLPNRVMLPPFDDAWITSWGAERRDGIFDNRGVSLQVVHARLLDRDKCNNITQRFAVAVSENFICLSQSGKRAPCTRDTGAPAVSDGVLWGLASWGIRKLCGTERFPAVFSYTGSQSNMNFIVNATHYLMSEERNYPFLDRFPVKKISMTTALITLPYK